MSEEMDSPNICVPEDAFEQFQAVTPCEDDDEFIMLSDIVPPQQPKLDFNACLHEIPEDPCAVSEPDPHLLVNVITEPADESIHQILNATGDLTDIDLSLATTSVVQQNNQIPKNDQQPTPMKRGRRKKSTFPSGLDYSERNNMLSNVTFDYYNSSLETVDQDSCITSYNKTSDMSNESLSAALTRSSRRTKRRPRQLSPEVPVKTKATSEAVADEVPKRKRGRPKKVVTPSNTLDISKPNEVLPNQQHKSLHENVSSEIANHSNLISIINPSDPDKDISDVKSDTGLVQSLKLHIEKKKPGRRGRKKKCEIEATNTIEDEKLSDGTLDINTTTENSSNNSTKTRKRKSSKTAIDKKYDDIELELLRMLSTPTDEFENECKEPNDSNQNPPKKRSRKPKETVENLSQEQTSEKYQIDKHDDEKDTHDDHDDVDDEICLSSLKKQLTPQEKITEEPPLNTDYDTVIENKEILNITKEAPAEDNKCLNISNEVVSVQHVLSETIENNITEPFPYKRSSKKPIMSDFEYNIDAVVKEPVLKSIVEETNAEARDSQQESPSKRPVRKKAKKVLHYDEGSDEDPFANVELSEDEGTSGRQGGRYYSDDEYIPGKIKKGKKYTMESESSISESDELENIEEVISKKHLVKRKGKKKLISKSDVTSTAADTTTQNDEDLTLQSPDITTNDNSIQRPKQAWGMSHEFEKFISQKTQGTNLQIKKVSGATSNESSFAPLEIPVLDPKEPKKSTEVGTQTNKSLTKTVEVQTSAPYEGKMKAKIPLSVVQSEKACDFLKGIVKNTADLGQLMIQKSEDFIQKKINTTNVTDTNKLEYCVQKSFLLFKLAKHNLIQMEEDLANEYEQYLKSHHLSQFRDSPKLIAATPKPINSDSDCEIVEENIQQKKPAKDKSKFNLKTVFLNKELSIKIAKKPGEEPQTKKEQLNVKGRHTVWINDSIMVKKVKPTQSFLAQDSRNKKPPDTYVTLEMVKTFFDNYYKQQRVLSACSPFVSPQWLKVNQISICSYFIADSDDKPHSGVLLTQQQASDSNNVIVNNETKDDNSSQPRSLQTLCTRFWQNYLYEHKYDCKDDMPHSGVLLTQQQASDSNNVIVNNETKDDNSSQPRSLQTLCTRFWHNYLYENKYDCKDDSAPIKNSQVIQKYQPERLFTLSFDVISIMINDNNNILMQKYQNKENIINSLKTICFRNISNLIFQSQVIRNTMYTQMPVNEAKVIKMPQKITNEHPRKLISKKQIKIKTLFTICIETLQKTGFVTQNIDKYEKVKSLKRIALDTIKRGMFDYLCYPDDTFDGESGSGLCREMFDQMESWLENGNYIDNINKEIELTIKSVNTMSDDIFANIPDNTIQDNTSYLDDDESNFSNYDQYDYEGYNQENVTAESNWVSRVQLQELKSCIVLINNTSEIRETNDSNADCVTTQIKIEPLDEPFENVHSSIVKTEPTENDDEIINFTPLTTKLENVTNLSDTDAQDPCLPEPIISSYDMDSFEAFANSNKMLRTGIDYSLANDEVFSQSAQRVRKQHEPDMEDDNDIGMSLLVPHQSIEVAKDRLMESSSDENISTQKNISKKKRKIRPKNTRQKIKDVTINKDKNLPENEVTVLTRRMQERMRQVEKSNDSTDSDLESSLPLRRESSKKAQDKAKLKPNKDEEEDNQIQCNDVDSTDNLANKLIPSDENNIKKTVKKGPKTLLQIKNREDKSKEIKDFKGQDNSFVIQPDDPVELLECEPTLPMMLADCTEMESDNVEKPNDPSALEQETTYIERHGWKCFPVNNNDSKLYEYAFILLEKLPESFIETYFRYQGMADKDQDDADIDRLTNLQSLHRNVSKESKGRSNSSKVLPNGQFKSKYPDLGEINNADDDHCAEFSPSEDEGPNIDDEVAPPAPHQDAVENAMAKNSLMDIGSDSERPDKLDDKAKNHQSIKKEEDDQFTSTIRTRPGPKSKKLALAKEAESLMLTADKMMNKELALLHAPVILEADEVDIKDVPKKITPKSATRTSSRLQAHSERNTEKDSSSEEEKQWVNTKEKLLKRMVKKQENPRVDDAKRAKLVSEFIERRGDGPENRPRLRPRKLRSRKKFLERQKQISVLNRELFGEVDTTYTGRKHSQSLGKGRKNIRKVIDKKSLARSTVIANMEEFERKRRLNMQQMRLREVLGCEEGVNVLVINEEVCLEYDFEQMRPVVTIHPFFTKVMKAHQYEGVKFMWDACFESLSMVATGHAGGGCILAHCMGLGKTLQVLALLHTVLTHPGVGMQRVLVCCPLSTVLNWVDEIHKWIGPVTNQIKVFELSKLKKTYERAYQLEDWYSGGGIFIIGYELFRNLSTLDPVLDDIRPTIVNKIRTALLDPGPDIVICDEGHLLKNDASVLAVAMSRVSTRRRIVLTGTPMQNNLREYYCMVNFVKPSLLGTYSEYSNRFENPIMNGQHRDSREEDIKLMKARTHILHKVLEGCLQRQEASVLYPYLPKKHEYTVFIPPTKCQWDLYKHYIMKYALEQQQQQKQQKHSVLKDFHVLQKIWTHPQVLHNFLMKARDERNKFNNMIKEEKIEDDLAHEELAAFEDMKPSQTEVWWLQYLAGGDMLESLDSSNKFLVVFQLLEECIALGDKVLIFSTSLYTLDALEYFLKRINKWSLGQQYYRLDGSVPPEVRQKWCREFNAEININTKLFLISTRAGSLGLNLTAANRVIILDTSWNPAHDIQSIFRVYRFGQKKDCYIYRLVAMGTMEQKIYERSVAKQAVSCRVVDEQQIDRHYNMAELTELYRYDEEGSSVEAGLAAGVSDVALLRVAARARLHAVREHDSLLRGSREQHLPEHERNAAWMQFQEEHANKEMQNRLLEASQGIHRLMEADLAKASGSTVPKTENEEPAPKGRRGRKGAAANATPTPPPEESKTEQKEVKIDPDKEEAKVRKIMELLIKHNFHTTKQSHDITQLVGNVRRIVDAGGTGLDQCDELTRSIATVMLQEEDGTVASEIPPLTDIVAEESIPTANEIEIKSEAEPATSLDDDPSDGSLLVPVGELVRRTRGRPRKYSTVQPTPTPTVKRSRGRPRKITSDSDRSTLDDDSVLAELQSNSGMKSARLKNKPRLSYGSDSDDAPLVASVFSSREQSPVSNDAPVQLPQKKFKGGKRSGIFPADSESSLIDDASNGSTEVITKKRGPKSKTMIPVESSINLIDDDDDSMDRVSEASKETVEVPIVPQEETVKKKSRAIALKSTAKSAKLQPVVPSNLNGKTKRKAALAAEQSLESLDSDVVALDDDDEWTDDRVVRSKAEKNDKTSREMESTKVERKRFPSITVSDDEDASPNKTEAKEAVPLHPSMLSNANFIKIVAYAYQSNQLLDEDAAVLAAQYSTQKALKEVETTGKDITSGPLYDIAVKVLGKDVLKRLYEKKEIKKNDTSISRSLKKATKQDATAGNETIVPERNPPQNKPKVFEPVSQHPSVVPIGMFKGYSGNQKTPEVVEECILPDDDDVILGSTDNKPTPEPYYKQNSQPLVITSVSSKTPGAAAEEAIIPESYSQGQIFMSNTQPMFRMRGTKIEPIAARTEAPSTVGSQQKMCRAMNPSLGTPTVPQLVQPSAIPVSQPQYLTLTISDGKLVLPQSIVPDVTYTTTVPGSVPAPSNDTICLDSDEEDSAPPRRAPPMAQSSLANPRSLPTPVAVTTNTPHSVMTSVQEMPHILRTDNSEAAITPDIQTRIPQNSLPAPTISASHQRSTNSTVKTASKPPGYTVSYTQNKQNKGPQIITKEKAFDLLKNKETTEAIKSRCKPGDIVRITKSGNFEVLTRVEKLPDNAKPQTLHTTANESTSLVDRRKPSTTSSVEARPASPGNDPLSILKDVIHIQADEYGAPPTKSNVRIDKGNPGLAKSNISITKDAMNNRSGSSKTEPKQSASNSLLNPNATKNKIDCNTKLLLFKKNLKGLNRKKQASNNTLSPQPVRASIDLTHIETANTNMGDTNKATKSANTVMVGSSKDIILRGKSSGKATMSHMNTIKISSQMPKPSTSSVSKSSTLSSSKSSTLSLSKLSSSLPTKPSASTSKQSTSSLLKPSTVVSKSTPTDEKVHKLKLRFPPSSRLVNVKSEASALSGDKKRPSQWPASEPKKQKTGLLSRPTMTLKDFNIDDIDDIIELE